MKAKKATGNELVEHKAAPLPSTEGGQNYFEAYGEQAAQRPIIGRILKFNKGDWLAGQDDEDIPEGTQLVAHMDTLSVGWTKWEGDRPGRQVSGLIVEGYIPPKRTELGDLDESLWELDDNERPRDPWVLGNQMVLRSVDDPNDLYTFVTSSRGGINMIGELSKAYGKEMRVRPDEYPIIELASDQYKHPQYGRVKTPVMKLVGWAEKDPPEEAPKPAKTAAKKTTARR